MYSKRIAKVINASIAKQRPQARLHDNVVYIKEKGGDKRRDFMIKSKQKKRQQKTPPN